LIRLPMWMGLSEAQQQRVCEALGEALKNNWFGSAA
jgi:dTDP-4-amino-4,6-dideoxygalactose transaminase